MADPENKWSILKKQITSKGTKTEADADEIAHISFLGSLYMGENGPVIPSYVIDGMCIMASKKIKNGTRGTLSNATKAGLFCSEHMRLEYDGPKTAEELWHDKRFVFTTMVIINRARVVCTRPWFQEWKGILRLKIDDRLLNESQVDDILNRGGIEIGLCDWRPRYGRFAVEKFK